MLTRFLMWGVGTIIAVMVVTAGIIIMAPYIAMMFVGGILIRFLFGSGSKESERERSDPPSNE